MTPRCLIGRGYSLLETMTVIVVILTLATLATPMFRTLIVRGREAVLREDLFTLRAQIDRFTHDYERGPVSLEELVEKQYMGSIPTDPFTGSNQTWQVETTPVITTSNMTTPAPGATPPEPGGELYGVSLSVDSSALPGIADVHSGSPDTSLDGTPYSSW